MSRFVSTSIWRSALAAAALLASAPIGTTLAQAPPRIRVVDINQASLEKWLVLYPDVAAQLGSQQQPAEALVNSVYSRACRKAGLADVAQCRALDDYMGALLGGADEQKGQFVDPGAKARGDLAALLADRRVPAKEKAQEKANIEGFIASLPANIPLAHLALLNQNAKRVFAVLAQVQGPQQGAPPPGPANKR